MESVCGKWFLEMSPHFIIHHSSQRLDVVEDLLQLGQQVDIECSAKQTPSVESII